MGTQDRMWWDRLFLLLLLSVFVLDQGFQTSFRPQNCTLHCVCQGFPGCEYCRISKDDVETTLGLTSAGLFAGLQSPEVCQHYVHAPKNVTIDFLESQNPKHETVVVSWRPSQYGIAFLRGFLVSLQTLAGSHITCQLFLLQNNMSLSAVHAQRMYYSDPFTDLYLGTQYAVTVMALPVPEIWDKFYHSKLFFTRSCPEKSGLEHCKKDWYPMYIEVHQDNKDIVVTFNLAPKKLGINRYFSSCYGGGSRSFEMIQPDFSVNSTHHTYRLLNLHIETNYTCEIAADIVDAVRKTFFVQIQDNVKEPLAIHNEGLSLAVFFSVGILLVISFAVIFAIYWQKKQKKKAAKIERPSDINEEHYDEYTEHQFVPVTNRTSPPQLLICYSSSDGSAHVKVVLQLATFVQKHMATEVHLDLWDSLSMTAEGDLGWYCRKIKESDFVLVICSKGLNQRWHNQREEVDQRGNMSLAIIAMIGEEIFRAKSLGQDLSKYMTAIFEYSKMSDIPTILSLASHYTLPKDLPLLFSHLHGVALQKPGAYLQIENISQNGYSKLPAGAALLLAIQDARILITGL